MERPLRIGVIGSGNCDEETAETTRDIGSLIAAAGATLICGGLGGVMAAAAESAAARGGLSVGILPGDDPRSASAGISLPIPTGLGDARNVLVVRASHAVIAVGGAWGTLSEAAICLKNGIPLIRLSSELPPLPVPEADTPEGAVEWALGEARRRAAAEGEVE